jgi:hypothetical protein
MLSNLSAYLDALTRTQTPPFSLETIPGFPYDEYQKRLTVYQEADYWYTGEVLEEIRSKGGTDYEVYPVKINPLIGAVQKHTFALFGEVGEDDRPLVSPKVVFMTRNSKNWLNKQRKPYSRYGLRAMVVQYSGRMVQCLKFMVAVFSRLLMIHLIN